MAVTLWTTCFGSYGRFLDGWIDAAMRSGADEILVASDTERPVPDGVRLEVVDTDFRFREAGFRNEACGLAEHEWLWQIDVDDRIVPDAASMLEGQSSGVVQVGYQRSDGQVYIPSVIANERYLASGGNSYVAGSPFTRKALEVAGGFPDVALSDWGLWRKMARAGVTFAASGRIAYLYRWEPHDSLTGVYTDPQHVADVMAL